MLSAFTVCAASNRICCEEFHLDILVENNSSTAQNEKKKRTLTHTHTSCEWKLLSSSFFFFNCTNTRFSRVFVILAECLIVKPAEKWCRFLPFSVLFSCVWLFFIRASQTFSTFLLGIFSLFILLHSQAR